MHPHLLSLPKLDAHTDTCAFLMPTSVWLSLPITPNTCNSRGRTGQRKDRRRKRGACVRVYEELCV
jgi:hypothetical protein